MRHPKTTPFAMESSIHTRISGPEIRTMDRSMSPSFTKSPLVTVALAGLAAAMLAALPACKKSGDDHAAKTSPGDSHGDEHAGHDHGDEAGGHADEVVLTAEAIDRYGVKVELAQMWILKPTFVVPARIGFNNEAMAHVGSAMSGRVVDVKVRVGDQVKTGDELVVIESAELAEAQSDYYQKGVIAQSAVSAIEVAKLAWERAKTLHEKSDSIPLSEVQRREGEYKAAVAAKKTADAAVVGAENRLQVLGMSREAIEAVAATGTVTPRSSIRAAIDGQVVQREVTNGELVGPDRESLMILADTSTVWVLAEVPEARLTEVEVGSDAWITPGIAGGRKYEGHITFISPFVEPGTRTAQVRIEVPADPTLKPGMFAEVEIVGVQPDGATPEPVIALPDSAIQTVENATSIFVPVQNEANTFQRRAVTIGKAMGGMVPVYAGLVEGERVVTAGAFILKAELGKSAAEHVH